MRYKPEVIKTKRLVLKSLADNDYPEMKEMLLDKNISKTYMIPDFDDENKIRLFFERLKKLSLDSTKFIYGIYLNNVLIGFINEVYIEDDCIELGYFISSKNWNQGFASEALEAAIKSLFDMGYNKIEAAHFESNLASGKVMQKCGMKQINRDEFIQYRGKNHKCIYYLISK